MAKKAHISGTAHRTGKPLSKREIALQERVDQLADLNDKLESENTDLKNILNKHTDAKN